MKGYRGSFTWILILSVILAGCSQWVTDTEEAYLSGFLEGRTYTIAAEIGGTVAEILVEDGQRVQAGQILISLDPSQLVFDRMQAEAVVAAAQAALRGLESQPSQAAIEAQQAAVMQALATLDAAQGGLDLLLAAYEPFDPPDADLHAAESNVVVAQAGVEFAQALRDQVEAGPLETDLIAARADLKQAQIALRMVELQIEHLDLRAPVDGAVRQVLASPGAVALPGTPLIMITDLDSLRLTVYIPVEQLASISIGDPAALKVDAYPGVNFPGSVIRIADRAQFTPSQVQTREERVKMVFAVEIQVADPDGRLKAGMPADARLGSE